MKNLKLNSWLFGLGFLGVLSALPLIPILLEAQSQPIPIPMSTLQLISAVQSAVLLIILVLVGSFFASKVGLKAPVLSAIVNGEDIIASLKPQLLPALIGGTAGGILLIAFFALMQGQLPAEFLAASETLALPWYTRLLYGGITEEILVRWGIMSFFVWLLYRLTQTQEAPVRPYNFVFGIVVSAILFGVGHLPAASILSPEMTPSLVLYIIFANSIFGFIAGYLFWKRGLESAILAHMMAHVVLMISSAFS